MGNKKTKKNNKKSSEKNIYTIIGAIAAAVVIVLILAVVTRSCHRSNVIKDIEGFVTFPEGAKVESYRDDEKKDIVRVTDKDGKVTEYYINEDGQLVTRTTETIVNNNNQTQEGEDGDNQSESTPESTEVKIIESYADKDGNVVTNTILPDGTTVTEKTDSEGNSTHKVDIPETPLTTYISYGDASSTTELKTPEITELDYSSIVGYVPMYSSSEEKEILFGVEMPYAVGDTGMVIESIGSFIGPYVEDGSDEELENVAALIITNTSDAMIQFSTITFTQKKGNPLNFVITNLPSKTSMIVFEKDRYAFKGDEVISYENDLTAFTDRNLHTSEVSISASDNLISVRNNTEKTIDTAYVYYKIYVEGGVFFGGITYRAKVENIAPGETVTQGASHYFINSSEVLCADIIYAE